MHGNLKYIFAKCGSIYQGQDTHLPLGKVGLHDTLIQHIVSKLTSDDVVLHTSNWRIMLHLHVGHYIVCGI